MTLPPSLRPLADAATQLSHGNEHAALALADTFTTSRVGFSALLFGRYRITSDGTEWDTERLATELDEASRADLATAHRIAKRASDVGRVLSFSEGSDRREVFARLSREQPITAGADPYRPVNVKVTSMRQRQIDLGKDFDRAQLRVAEAGPSGAPALFLIHGHASRIEEYEVLAGLLSKDFRVVMVDLLGSGYSEKPAIDYSIDGLSPMLERAMDVLGLSDVRVAGGGLGGNLALRLSYRDGLPTGKKRIRKASAWSVAGWGETKPLLATGARLLRHAPDVVFYPVAEQQLSEQYASAYPDRLAMIAQGMAYRREVYTRTFQDAYFSIAADQVGTTMLPHATEITTPVQLLTGDLDTGRLQIRAAVEHLASVMKKTACIIPGSGYAIANEQPEKLARELAAFLRP